MKVRYSYLSQQFAEPDEVFQELRKLVASGDFTLGYPVQEFEDRFADLMSRRHAIGVNSGTDALKLPLKALGLSYRDEVITTANTFVATVGAINELGCRPVFVDCDDTFVMDVDQVEGMITSRTRAIMPVHLAGYAVDMPRLMKIATDHDLPVVEDACQGILAEVDNQLTGSWGIAAGFSLHPLKNLNVWGDGGVIVTDDDSFAEELRLLRNHGLAGRDEVVTLGYNSRLDSVQAVVGNWLIDTARDIANGRIENAKFYDEHLKDIPEITIPPRPKNKRAVFNIYIVFAENRDELYRHCLDQGVECKVHYPVPIYRQPALEMLGHKEGDFPVTDRHARTMITLPVDEHLSQAELELVVSTIRAFYGRSQDHNEVAE